MRCKARVAAAHEIVRAPRDRALWFSLVQQITNAVVLEWHEDRCDTQDTVLEHWLGLKSHSLGGRPHVQMTEPASGAITATEMLAPAGRELL